MVTTVSAAPWALAPAPIITGFGDAPWPTVVSTLLALRGHTDTASATAWMDSTGPDDDPFVIPGFHDTVDRLAVACWAGERVGIIGDYDVDGVTSAVILSESLEEFGAQADVWLPDRFVDGYGPSERAVQYLYERGASVLVTVDCGTSAVDEIALARHLGMDVLVIDHHSPPDVLPDAYAIVNPKLDGVHYPSEPAACAIAFRTMRAVQALMDVAWTQGGEHLALAALGSVCDMVPLTGEQRKIVRLGLPRLQRSQRVGLNILAQHGGFQLNTADEHTCGWRIGPRINAAGRMAHASLAFNLLRETDPAAAMPLGSQIESLNRERQRITAEATETAYALLDEHGLRDSDVALVAHPSIAPGVAGLVAARLARELHRPAIALHLNGDIAVGSVRSVGDYDCTALLRRHADLFERLGGHRAAAGCTLRADRIEEARERLVADAASTLTDEQRLDEVRPEADLEPREMAGEVGTWIARLAPFGMGNPQPLLRARDVRVIEQRAVGADNAHLAVVFDEGVRGIAFGHGALTGSLAQVDMLYRPVTNHMGGGLQADITEITPRS